MPPPSPSAPARPFLRALAGSAARRVGALAAAAALVACADAPAPDGPAVADLLVTNGRVYTLTWDEAGPGGAPAPDAPWTAADGWRPDAEAVAVADGRILFVGSAADAEAYRGPDTRVLDVEGATVLPGLVDSHTHVVELGRNLGLVDLVDVASPAEAVERAAARAAELPEGSWVVGTGWDEGAWADAYPTAADLDERIPDHPVYLRGLHGFAVWTNTAGLAAAGIDGSTEAPVGGQIVRDSRGRPTGMLLNRATTLLDAALPEADVEDVAEHWLAGLEEMARAGYVGVHEAGSDALMTEAVERLAAEGRLPLRVYAMLSARDEALLERWLRRGPDTDPSDMLQVRSVKAYYDGALGSRGARLIADYSDRPGHRGVSGEGYGFAEAPVEAMMRAGFQVGIHAIGDAGNRETLDFLERVRDADPAVAAGRHRIEHAQVVHPDDFRRFVDLGLVASMEPPHAVEDMDWAEERVGPDRIRGAYAWRTFEELEVPLTFNSDLPGSDHDVFYGLHAAVTRRDRSGLPEGGWHPEQAVTPEEAVRAYTTGAAYAAFLEDSTGVLAPGRWADLTVLSVDPFRAGSEDPSSLLDGEVVATVVAGRVVHGG